MYFSHILRVGFLFSSGSALLVSRTCSASDKANLEFVLEQGPKFLYYANHSVRDNAEFMMRAVAKDGMFLQHASSRVRRNRAVVLRTSGNYFCTMGTPSVACRVFTSFPFRLKPVCLCHRLWVLWSAYSVAMSSGPPNIRMSYCFYLGRA